MRQQEIYYFSPTVDVTEVAMEQGFAISGYGSDCDDSEFENYY